LKISVLLFIFLPFRAADVFFAAAALGAVTFLTTEGALGVVTFLIATFLGAFFSDSASLKDALALIFCRLRLLSQERSEVSAGQS
jgi:hypothetical protein